MRGSSSCRQRAQTGYQSLEQGYLKQPQKNDWAANKPRPSDHRVGQKCIAVKSVECFPRMREMKEVAYLSHGITTAWRGRPIAVLANQEAEGGRMARAKRAR